MWTEIDGLILGDERWVETRDELRGHAISIEIDAARPVTKVEIIRNGTVITSEEPHAERFELRLDDADCDAPLCVDAQDESIEFVYYYIRITHDSGDLAWTSPTWFLHRR